MTILKYILPRFLAIIAFLFLANEIYKLTFWKEDVSKHGDILENLWVVNPNDKAIYFGESSNFHTTEKDTTKHRISNILNDLLPEIGVGTVDNAGLHSGTYLAVIKNIPEDSNVEILVITMNLRSFGADWRYAVGENYLAKTEVMIAPNLPLINKFLVSLKKYDFKSGEERAKQISDSRSNEIFDIPNFEFHNAKSWDSAMAWGHWKNQNHLLNKKTIPLACHYIKNFAFEIDENNNERVDDFDEIIEIADKRGYKIVFNLLAENMEEGEKLVGNNLIYLIEKNRDFLINRYTKKGAIVVDNLYAVPDSCFVDRDWPTEHYTKYGKTIIAENLSKAIRENSLVKP